MFLSGLIGAVFGAFSSEFFKYVWNKKFFLYQKKINAIEKLRDAVHILRQGSLLCLYLQRFNLEKIEEANEVEKHKIQNMLDTLRVKQAMEKISSEIRELNIHNNVQPYVTTDVWKIFSAYRTIISSAMFILSSVPFCLNLIKKDKMEESFIKDIVPIIPQMERFIREDPITRIFYVEDLVLKKLLEAIEGLK